ncbi:DUF3320 domain-containing protein [Acetobacter malorum]|uniref:DUF3320 domain-containing protein n=1 Tax=Acetobacter malorum TaxID=178901 RepID=UPI000A36F7DF|nr:DUF3320 domain-containing protein [Acetobacter malorum]
MDLEHTEEVSIVTETPQPAPVPAPPASPVLKVSLQDALNASLWENSVPVLLELALQNETDRSFSQIDVTVSSEPPVIRPRAWHLQQIDPGQFRTLKDLDLKLDGAFLSTQTEASRATVTFLATDKETGEELTRHTTDVRVLARNEWGGLSGIPDILAAFVMPNDPAIARILRSATEILKKEGLSSSLEGYQGSKERVWQQAQAIWCAICQLDLAYINPPASFIDYGQRVRLPSQIVEDRLATCLDTAVLFAACLEAVGIRPIIVLTQGHAFTGFWLAKLDAGVSVMQDLPALRNRLKLQDLAVFETTLVTAGRKPSFSVACEKGEANLRHAGEDEENTFREIIDIHRARLRRIHPLSCSLPSAPAEDQPDAEEPEAALPAFEPAPVLREDPQEVEEDKPSTPADRLQRWCNRLLDMSGRNRLLNLPRSDKQLIVVDCPNPSELENHLAAMRSGRLTKPLRFCPWPDMMDEGDPRQASLHHERHHEDAARAYAEEALGRNELLVSRKENQLQAALTELYRRARAAEHEGGSNVLFLTIGALAWTAEGRDKPYLAPLILIPVILERPSVKSGFVLRAHPDESRINATLLEMLQADYGLRFPALEGETLPEDESGLDVDRILELFRVGLRSVPGWEVRDYVTLTTLSFAKFLMWKDLQERSDKLRTSEVATRLLDGITAEDTEAAPLPRFFEVDGSLDEALVKADLICPMEADSSQLKAVARAASGESFVLIGPPGTGKSQTITNIIANTLAQNRTILFVAEKRTALEVVRNRLKQIGLAEFCLDLFSPKASKLAVLGQLEAAQTVLENFSPDEWDRSRQQLDQIRTELNNYVVVLHQKWRNGWTAYRAIGVTLRADDAQTLVIPLSWPDCNAHTAQDYQTLADTAENIASLYDRIGDVVQSPKLAGLEHVEWSPIWEGRLLDAVSAALASLSRLRTAAEDAARALGLGTSDLSLRRLRQLNILCGQLLKPEACAWAFPDTSQQTLDSLLAEKMPIARHAQLKGELRTKWKPEVLNLPLESMVQEWQESKEKWIFARSKIQKGLRKKLESHTTALPDECEDDLVRLAAIQALEKQLKDAQHHTVVGPVWQGLDTDFSKIEAMHAWGAKTRSALAACAGDTAALLAARTHLNALLRDGMDLLRTGGPVHHALTAFQGTLAECQTSLEALGALSGSDALALVENSQPTWPDTMTETLQAWKQSARDLRDWCSWKHACQDAVRLGLTPLITAIEHGLVASHDVTRVFEANYARWWVRFAIDQSPLLRGFVAAKHEKQIERFRTLDRTLMEMSVRLIRSQLAGQIPDARTRQTDPEYKVLTRELAKKMQHLPIRQLAEKMPTALRRLTPCLMMSPLSVAQYLPADATAFDLVIFDEASQIPTWDAIGAIGRGKQVIVVGDPKQLPPTDFFNRTASDTDEVMETQTCDLESILDECLGAGVPPVNLSWHYRSRHESLIAFSNQAYYGGQLITFPSPVTKDQAVSFRFVPGGVYMRGAGRTNPVEARAVVAEALRLLQDGSERSLGIVTFNSDQQTLITDLMDKARSEDPALERFFSDDAAEPVLIRNLENVQGEERDIMLFSLTYGPDQAGKITLNFGPLNRDGGERRLNVAITRARERLIVFGSLHGDQIDIARTQAVGVHDLRKFLTFAEHGATALAGLHEGSVGDFDSDFEKEVAALLRLKGWQVVPQIGVSGFRVDLGVVDPDRPTTFLAGVECDGATYHRSATARDRDRLRQAVLENLGWTILRIWSTDWWTNAQRECDRLDKALHALLTKIREERAAQEEEEHAHAALLHAETDPAEAQDAALTQDDAQDPKEHSDHPDNAVSNKTTSGDPGLYARAPEGLLPQANPVLPRNEQETSEDQPDAVPDQALFFKDTYTPTLIRLIQQEVKTQGPVREDLLVQSISRQHGFARAGREIRERLQGLIPASFPRTQEDVGTFVWPETVSPDAPLAFKAPTPHETLDPATVPLAMLVSLAKTLLLTGLPDEELITTMRKACGMGRMGAATRARFEAALARSRAPENSPS